MDQTIKTTTLKLPDPLRWRAKTAAMKLRLTANELYVIAIEEKVKKLEAK